MVKETRDPHTPPGSSNVVVYKHHHSYRLSRSSFCFRSVFSSNRSHSRRFVLKARLYAGHDNNLLISTRKTKKTKYTGHLGGFTMLDRNTTTNTTQITLMPRMCFVLTESLLDSSGIVLCALCDTRGIRGSQIATKCSCSCSLCQKANLCSNGVCNMRGFERNRADVRREKRSIDRDGNTLAGMFA